MTDITPSQVLDLALPENDAGATTVRGYLIKLLDTLWREEEGFSGKRPFGNSGWQWDIYMSMAKAGMVAGTFDEEGYLDDFPAESERQAESLVLAAIASLGQP